MHTRQDYLRFKGELPGQQLKMLALWEAKCGIFQGEWHDR
jgi:hypothetical protein